MSSISNERHIQSVGTQNRWFRARVLKRLEVLASSRIPLEVTDGLGCAHIGNGGKHTISITVADPKTYSMIGIHGLNGAIDSYLAGLWDTNNLVELIATLMEAPGSLKNIESNVSQISNPIQGFIAPTRSITYEDHLKLGNDFFKSFLGKIQHYSTSAQDSKESLRLKADQIAELLGDAKRGGVLSLGNDWGLFDALLQKSLGTKLTRNCATQEQYESVKYTIKSQNLYGKLIPLHGPIENLQSSYSGMVCIDNLAYASQYTLSALLRTVQNCLQPGGTFVFETIVDRASERRFKNADVPLSKYVMPHMAPMQLPQILMLASDAAMLECLTVVDNSETLIKTLRRWRETFEGNKKHLLDKGHDEFFLRLWRLFLAHGEAAAISGRIRSVLLVLKKGAL